MVSHSLEDVKRIIGNKADLYEAAVRNGWYLPKYKSSIITEDYITTFEKRGTAGIDDSHLPDKDWLLAVLGTYNPQLPYF